jgi:tetratricopeptide (TPR) repeat protein
VQRFQREGIAAGQFTHPNAIQIFDFDMDEGPIFYLAMEYVEGLDLKQMIRDEGAQPIETALAIARQILGALAEAHRHGIVHRDLKPENVMVIRGSGPPRVKVLDFGLSKLVDRPLDASLTAIGRVMGTPLYMSPEQVAGDVVDHRTDIYAVGLILYEMLSGKTPFSGKTLQEILAKHLKELPPSVVELSPELKIPAELEQIVFRALEKQREARYQSADAMLAALNSIDLGGPLAVARPGAARSGSSGSLAPRRGLSRWVPWTVAGLVLLPLALFAVLRPEGAERGGARARQRETPLERRTAAQSAYLALLDSAQADLLAGDTTSALTMVQEAFRAEVVDAEAYFVRGLAYRAKRDGDTARLDFEEALNLDPGYGDAAAELGWMLLDQGDRQAALARFLEAGRIDPGSAEALVGQGAVRLAEGDPAAARSLLDKALVADPDSVRAHLYSGRAHLAAGAADQAIDAFARAKRSEQGSWEARVGLAQAYMALSRWEDAEVQFREALAIAPEVAEPRALFATALFERGDPAEARAQLADAAKLEPENGALRHRLALAWVDAGSAEKAIPELERAVELGAGGARTALLLGILEQERGRIDRALEHYDAALAADEGQAQAHANRGAALMELGRYEDARAPLERAAELDPAAPFPHLCLGVLFMEFLGDSRLATEHLRRYQELGGQDPRAAEWLRRRVR